MSLKKKLKLLEKEEQQYIVEKTNEYQHLLGIENSGDGWNDSTDGFRHVWGTAYLAIKYNNLISWSSTTFHEHSEKYQPNEEKKMDLLNNKIGIEIANELQKEYKNLKKNFTWSEIEDMIAGKAMKKIKENKIITSTTDSSLNSNQLFKLQINKNINNESFKEKLIRMRKERLARYTQRLAESPEKIAEKEASHTSLEELMAPQEARRQRIHDIVQGTVEFDENGDYSAYENKKSGDNKIFTQEEIDEMSDEEREKNKAAILYQKQTIGVPTKEQAEKSAAKGGMVYVNSYVRKDGTKVKAYYRSR